VSCIYIGDYISHGGDVESHVVLIHVHYVGQITQLLVRECQVMFAEILCGNPVTAGCVHSKVTVLLRIMLLCKERLTGPLNSRTKFAVADR